MRSASQGQQPFLYFRSRPFPSQLRLDREASEYTTAVAEGVGNASNCGVPAKIRTRSGSGAKEIAAHTARPVNGQFGGMCVANCDKPASTRISWANKAKEIVVGIARLVEVANFGRRGVGSARAAHRDCQGRSVGGLFHHPSVIRAEAKSGNQKKTELLGRYTSREKSHARSCLRRRIARFIKPLPLVRARRRKNRAGCRTASSRQGEHCATAGSTDANRTAQGRQP
jgi:hypothetical protein